MGVPVCLVTRHASRIFSVPHYVVNCGLVTLPYFAISSDQQRDFWQNFIEEKMCILSFSTKFV
jgi:glutamate dehydrogenase/leucine dehydrogenase